MATADVGDAGPALEPLDDAVERGQPRLDEVGVVAGAEEPLAALVDVVVVLVPAEPVALTSRLGDALRVDDGAERDLEEPRQVGGAVLVGERHRLLGREAVAALVGVVVHVAAGRLGVQPLPYVALGGTGAGRQLARRERTGPGERTVEAEPVAHHHQRGFQRGPDLLHRAGHKLLELRSVERAFIDGRHLLLFPGLNVYLVAGRTQAPDVR